MKVKRFTQFASVLAIFALIVGLSACDQFNKFCFPHSLKSHLRW